MGFFNKLNKSLTIQGQAQSKTRAKIYPVIAYIFFVLGSIIFITQIIDNKIGRGVFILTFFIILGSLYLWAGKMNKRFLIKTGGINKTYKELTSDYMKAWEDKTDEHTR